MANAIDPLSDYKEGVRDAHGRPVPLTSTAIDVAVEGCFATVRTRRVFRNDEAASIEATMTFPVPVDAAAHGLRVEIDARVLAGHAEPKAQARETYEAALDAGKPAVLHEEALKGVHVLSIAHIAPGREVAVEIAWSKPLSLFDAAPTLRIPNTVAEIYGRLPLLPADDIVVDDSHVFVATLTIAGATGRLNGRAMKPGTPVEVPLDRPIDLAFDGLAGGQLEGEAADGRRVSLAVERDHGGDGALRLGILFDRSGSTNSSIDGFGGSGQDTWHAAISGLSEALERVRPDDAFEIWQFDSVVEHVGAAKGPKVARLLRSIGKPRGGTEAGVALEAATRCEVITDVLFITDGRTGAIPVQAFAAGGKRVSAVLCGANSLDAMIGHLCALTGGQVVVAASDNIAAAIESAVAGARRPIAPPAAVEATELPPSLETIRGGARIVASWSGEVAGTVEPDAVGAYAAALALPGLREEAATRIAVAHGLCTHLTSLVVVDEAAEAQAGLPNQRKVPLSRPIEADRMLPPLVGAASLCPTPRQAAVAAAAPCPEAPAASYVEAAPCVPRARSRPAAPRDGSRERGVPIFRRLWPRPADTVAPGALQRVAAGLDWDGDAHALAAGDLSGLTPGDRRVVQTAARYARIVELAQACGMTPEALVVALMALTAAAASRSAERLERLLAALSDADVTEAVALLDL